MFRFPYIIVMVIGGSYMRKILFLLMGEQQRSAHLHIFSIWEKFTYVAWGGLSLNITSLHAGNTRISGHIVSRGYSSTSSAYWVQVWPCLYWFLEHPDLSFLKRHMLFDSSVLLVSHFHIRCFTCGYRCIKSSLVGVVALYHILSRIRTIYKLSSPWRLACSINALTHNKIRPII